MFIVSGIALVLVTWTLCVLALTSLGLMPALALDGSSKKAGAAAPVLRRALWWGLLIAAIFSYVANLAWPLHGGATAIAGLALVGTFGIPGWALWLRRHPRWTSVRREPALLVLWIVLGLSLVYLAAAALGPVTNYDSGLYHLGAIKYASDFPTIPGLANVYFAFGYGNAEFPLAALLGNGPWQDDGFRLLNGLIMVLAVAELGLRARQRRPGPGFFVLLAGVLVAWVPMVALSDYWVTSPTQDSSVFIVTIVATAYLAQAALGGRAWMAEGATAAVLGVVLVLLRPTMVAFTGLVVMVLLALIWRRRAVLGAEPVRWAVALTAGAGIAAAAAATARDWVLSGWWQYPLSLHAFAVPWVAADPREYRIATLGYHRNPADLWNSIDGWSWVGPWLANRLSQWETFEFAGLVLVGGALALVATRAARSATKWSVMVLAVLPSVGATAVWWVATPPSYRFVWGPLFTIATVPIGWSMWLLASRRHRSRISASSWLSLAAVAVAIPVLLVTAYSAVARFHADALTAEREWHLAVPIPYVVAPVTEAPVRHLVTSGGVDLLQPLKSDQCWGNFPLCTPVPSSSLAQRGSSLADGFVH